MTLIVYVWWSCPQFRLIAMKLICEGNSLILRIYSLEERRHHLFRTILAKYTNPFWQNDYSSIPNSHYKWHRFRTSCGHHDESELKTCLMRARHLFYIATCISEYTKVMYSLSCTFKTWMQCVVSFLCGPLIGLSNSQRNKTLIFWHNINYKLFKSTVAGWSLYIMYIKVYFK